MINMRKVDYMGSRPFASKLLFAPPTRGSHDSFDEEDVDLHDPMSISTQPSEDRLSEKRPQDGAGSVGFTRSIRLAEPAQIKSSVPYIVFIGSIRDDGRGVFDGCSPPRELYI